MNISMLRLIFVSLFLISTYSIFAQKYDRVATRCVAVEKSSPVLNIFIDAENVKWVANTKSIAKVNACDLSSDSPIASNNVSSLQFSGGNIDKRWMKGEVGEQARIEIQPTASFFDEKNDILWLGSKTGGLFQFKEEPKLTLVDRFTDANSKLKSNEITTLFQENSGRVWVGSTQGVMYGTPGKWKYDLNGYSIKRIRSYGGEIYALGEDEIWKLQTNEKWINIPLDERWYEKDIRDFDFEKDGSLWLLSSIVARVDLATDAFVPIAGPENYTSEFGTCIAVDIDGAAWVGTTDKGLFIIEKITNFTVNCIVEQELSCGGTAKDGALKVKITNNDGPFTYAWSGGLSGDNPKNLGAGTYIVTVTDKKGISKTAKAILVDPRIEVVVSQVAPCSKDKADGKASANAKGGKGKYIFLWDNGEKTATATQLNIGKHSMTTTDASGCTSTNYVDITENVLLLTATLELEKEIKCHNEKTALRVNIKGGKSPFTYTWSDVNLKGAFVDNLGIGDYQVSIVDAMGAKATAFTSIGQPEKIILSAIVTAPANIGKSDGKALASAKGGKGKFTFAWDNGETTAAAEKLSAGAHTVTVMDAVGCVVSASLETGENVLPLVATIDVLQEIKCFGDKSALKVNVSGGKSPYTYTWSDPNLKGEIPQNVSAGNYELKIEDATGKKSNVNVLIEQPEKFIATTLVISSSSVGKSDGKASVSSRGGKPKYNYVWDNGEKTATAINLASGKHTVTVTDANGCVSISSIDITENVLPLSATIDIVKEIKCNGGEATLKVNTIGGKSPFTYSWSNSNFKGETPNNVLAGEFQVSISDAAGSKSSISVLVEQPESLISNAIVSGAASTGKSDGKATASAKGGKGKITFLWDNGETSATASKLSAGKHTVTATDANGCNSTSSVEITENILPLSMTFEVLDDIKCNGEKTKVKINTVGGKAPFTYTWSNPSIKGDTPENVSAGDYKVEVLDATGTKASVSVSIEQPELVTVLANVTSSASVGKSDGKATASAKGGKGKYTFAWDNGETSATASKLSAGKHTVTATDANGCNSTSSVEITENILPLTITFEALKDIKCNGEKTNVKITTVGGKAPFTYTWSNPSIKGDTPENVAAGEYKVDVLDAVGTKASVSVSIEQPEIVTATASLATSASVDKSDGKATASAKGGKGKITFAWDNGETSATASKLSAGKHTVTATDANGCTCVSSVEITENILPLSMTFEVLNDIRCNGEKTKVKINTVGGKAPFTYTWSNPIYKGDSPENVVAGDYKIDVIDATGTKATLLMIVNQPEAIKVDIVKTMGATTDKTRDGHATLKVSGGSAIYTFAWDNGESLADAKQLIAGKHTVTVTDAKGCSTVAEVEIKKRILPELNAAQLQNGQAVRMEQLQFEADSTNLNESCLPVMNEVFDFLEENGSIVIEIGGHTNSTPTDEFCDRLSTARAKAVATYLITKGIDPKRVLYKGYGKRKPVTSNTTAEGRKKNQRVEIKIVSLNTNKN
jgi:outer membrane protein OmpA-like peptidoglycan-associated protein